MAIKSIKSSEYVSPRKASQTKKQQDSQEEPEIFKKYLCPCCGLRTNNASKFTRIKSEIYSAWDNRFPICTECLDKLFDHYASTYGTRFKALHRMCEMTNSYFDKDLFETIEKETNGGKTNAFLRSYLSKMHLRQYKGKTYDTYLDEHEEARAKRELERDLKNQDLDSGREETAEFFITPSMIRRWGTGAFVEGDYKTLEDHYHMLKDNNPNVDGNQEVFIKNLCHLHLLMTKAIGNEDTERFIKASDQYSKIFTKAGLKTIEEKDSSVDETLGVTLATMSKFIPEEYYRDKKRYSDFDGIGEYFKRFVLRPLKNLQFGTTDRDEEFKVKDEE